MVRSDGFPVFVSEQDIASRDPRSLTRASITLGAVGLLLTVAGLYALVAGSDAAAKAAGFVLLAYGGGHVGVASIGWRSSWSKAMAIVFSALGIILSVGVLVTPTGLVAGLFLLGAYGYVGLTLYRWREYRPRSP